MEIEIVPLNLCAVDDPFELIRMVRFMPKKKETQKNALWVARAEIRKKDSLPQSTTQS